MRHAGSTGRPRVYAQLQRAQFLTKALDGVRESFERLRENIPNDIEANLLLATIYQRLKPELSEGARSRHWRPPQHSPAAG